MILVTGGTGLVGSHLLLELVTNGNSVRAIHRKSSNLNQVQTLFSYYSENSTALFEKIQWIEADISDIPALEAAFIGITHVYHCAALISFDPKDHHKLKKNNVYGTANIVNLCLYNSIEKLCYISTIGTIGRSLNGEMSTEETDWSETDANVYALMKHKAEMEVWRGSQEGLSVAIVNPGVILGPTNWDQGSGTLFTTANKAYNFYPPGGSGFVTVNDVVRIMIQLMKASIKNERYIVVAENLSYQAILSRVTKSLGKKPPKKQLKIWQLNILRLADFCRCTFTGKQRKITRNSIRSFKNRQFFDNQKVKQDLNFEFEDLSNTIQFTAEQFLNDSAPNR
ncbi:NAD-dependent epimerase/dehydratase family protein [Aurantibacter crassamenti]|uniref:NAD-dependent epimerase/dehydratase family protein n=1 Tax=Aurantibacter crassamenti TaxID=1837375 RepID=UPI001939C5E5|nr:NAD-dependent epimerase/dehydratase family protein [Aurantibacter crassamenti]MBM1104792.1 NAD-dependent epimerase/dehydratase family protein [Aurantibacter crassamenti]